MGFKHKGNGQHRVCTPDEIFLSVLNNNEIGTVLSARDCCMIRLPGIRLKFVHSTIASGVKVREICLELHAANKLLCTNKKFYFGKLEPYEVFCTGSSADRYSAC